MAGTGVDKQMNHRPTAACPTPFSVNHQTINNAGTLAL